MPDISIHPGGQPPEDIKKAHAALSRRTDEATGMDYAYNPFYLTAMEDGRLVGFLSGHTGFHEVYVDDIIVDPDQRHGGTGKALLAALEQHCAGAGFDHVYLTTYAFQAPGFYKKCGYQLEFVRPYPKDPRLDKYHFVKYLK